MHAILLRLISELRGAMRFRRTAWIVAWLLAVFGWLAVLSIPNVYEASARVYLNTQSVLQPLLEGLAIAPNIESDLDAVRQAMTSGPAAEKIALNAGVELGDGSEREREAALAGFRSGISVSRASVEGRTDGIYRIAFRSTNREKSLEVVKQLLDLFVQGTLGNKRDDQEKTSKFLDQQIAEYEQRLTDAEERLADFQKANIGLMPSDKTGYFSRLTAEIEGLDTAQNSLSVAEARRDELQRQISGEEPYLFGLDLDQSAQQSSTVGGDVAVRIHDLEKRREDLLLRFTPKHPEVVGLDKQLAELHVRQQAELDRIRAGQPATGDLAESLKSNPVYSNLQLQLKQAAVQVAELRRDRDLRASRVAELRKLINAVPEVEAELSRLNRDYEATNAYYRRLLQSRETAKISTDADNTGTVSFQEIDPPIVPLAPVSPKRGLMLIAVLFAALAAGAGIAVFLNLLQPVYFDWETLQTSTEVPVVGCIRSFRPEDLRAVGIARLLPALTAVVLLLCTCGVIVLRSDQFSTLVRTALSGVI